MTNRLLPYHWQYTRQKSSQQMLRKRLQDIKPHVVVVSQGANYDGILFADVCRQLRIPYALVAQKATNSRAPYAVERAQVQEVYRKARRSYFVSQHNLELTQLQLGMQLPAAEVVRNPYNVPFDGELPWPTEENGVFRLACVARLFLSDKGQDILLQTLAQAKWRQRPLFLTLYGAGPDEAALRGMVEFLGLQQQVRFGGHVAQVDQVWRTHHALVLPSRYEGLPLALVEAMLSGRPAIAADAGGIAELLTDGVTGFLAAGLTVKALDEALENAWAARANWAVIGAEAARQARAIVPANALEEFAGKLLRMVYEAPPLPRQSYQKASPLLQPV
ncbi:glycosyltransferase [Hymenobacter sp. HSC-4F20]|nr:glycosyltransferase [Hymenobacter sp. HSC-4F20]